MQIKFYKPPWRTSNAPKKHLRNLFSVVIWTFSSWLIAIGLVVLPHRRGTTFFLAVVVVFFWPKIKFRSPCKILLLAFKVMESHDIYLWFAFGCSLIKYLLFRTYSRPRVWHLRERSSGMSSGMHNLRAPLEMQVSCNTYLFRYTYLFHFF